MGTLDGRYDTFHASKFVACIDSFIVVDSKNVSATFGSQLRMHRTNTWIVETSTYGKGFFYLTIIGLHNEGASTMNDTFSTTLHGCGSIVGINTMTTSLGKIHFHTFIVDIMIYGACCI